VDVRDSVRRRDAHPVIWYWAYALKPKRALSALAGDAPRRGALIRTGGGFADVHPWPELGDATIDEQLALLARGVTTRLTARSLRFASIDADARTRGVSLFEGLTIPESHWPGADPPPTFDTVKLKHVSRIPDGVRLRIDFNATLTADEFVRVAATLPRERVDFVEDPCPYDEVVWRSLRAQTGLRLALDNVSAFRRGGTAARAVIPSVSDESGWSGGGSLMSRAVSRTRNDTFDVCVIKPAVEDVPATEKELVVTSYMDHPVGQLGAAYVAAKHATSRRCGLVTHVLYESDPFIEQLLLDGARLVPPAGTGVGFDAVLEALPWKRLA
jgi:O-succinylbenzoate synthase